MDVQQWTYVYWDLHSWQVMHQTPDPLNPKGKVISSIIDKGHHQIPWQPGYCTPAEYAQKQIEIGLAYASEEWPLRTCEGKVISHV